MRRGRNYRLATTVSWQKRNQRRMFGGSKRSPRQSLFAKGRGDRNRQPDGLTTAAIIRELAKGF